MLKGFCSLFLFEFLQSKINFGLKASIDVVLSSLN